MEILDAYFISEEELDTFYGRGNWKRMPDETYKRLRHEPKSWTVEVHTVRIYMGTAGKHQDEFLQGDRSKDLLRNSIVAPSLLASILNCEVCEFRTAIPHRTGILPQRRQHFQTDHDELDYQKCP